MFCTETQWFLHKKQERPIYNHQKGNLNNAVYIYMSVVNQQIHNSRNNKPKDKESVIFSDEIDFDIKKYGKI